MHCAGPMSQEHPIEKGSGSGQEMGVGPATPGVQTRGQADKFLAPISSWCMRAQVILLTGSASQAQRRAGSDSGGHTGDHAVYGLCQTPPGAKC